MLITHPKNSLSQSERSSINELKENSEINIKRAHKGNTTVIMTREEKTKEGLTSLNVKENYKPLKVPVVGGTHKRVKHFLSELCLGHHID